MNRQKKAFFFVLIFALSISKIYGGVPTKNVSVMNSGHFKKVRRSVLAPVRGRSPAGSQDIENDKSVNQTLEQWKAKRAQEIKDDLPVVKHAMQKSVEDLQKEPE
jgi:hypothetical protein